MAEEKGKETVPEVVIGKRVVARITHVPYTGRAAVTAPVPEEKIAYYREIVASDFEGKYFDEEKPRYFPGGFDTIKALNADIRKFIKARKEFAAAQIARYEEKGYAEYCPTEANLHLEADSNPGEDDK